MSKFVKNKEFKVAFPKLKFWESLNRLTISTFDRLEVPLPPQAGGSFSL
jgi:hypothetical protein